MPPCNPKSAKATQLDFRCNLETGRYVKKTTDELVKELTRAQHKTLIKKEKLRSARREIKTLAKVQKVYNKLILDHMKLRVHVELLTKHIRKVEPKVKKPTKKKAVLPKLTMAEISQLTKESNERYNSKIDDIYRKVQEDFVAENPGVALPVDFMAERDIQAAKLTTEAKKVVHILIPRKKAKPSASVQLAL